MNPLLINPFREEAKEFLDISFEEISKDIIDFGIKKLQIPLNDTKIRKYLYPTDSDEIKDVVSFFVYCQALSKRPFSSEARFFATQSSKIYKARLEEALILEKDIKDQLIKYIKEIIQVIPFQILDLRKILDYRVNKTKGIPQEEVFLYYDEIDIKINDEIIRDLEKLNFIKISGESQNPKLLPDYYFIKWTDAEGLVQYTDSYIIKGYILVDKATLLQAYRKKMEQKILTYIKTISEKTKELKFHLYDEIFKEVSKISGTLSEIEIQSEELNPEVYPPCVIKALSGVGAGDRNYAITLFLTSFLSYSRLIPSTKIFSKDQKPSLNEKEINILINEIIPLILSAANKCNPPLLIDQPQEELNIYYHLGFGLSYPTLDNFGRSKWYLPPSCAKVKENAPSLCEPDNFCKMYFYEVTNKDILQNLKGNTSGEKILLVLKDRMRPINEIIEMTGLSEEEVKKQILAFIKNKTLTARRINNPFIYYLRKKRVLKRKADIIR